MAGACRVFHDSIPPARQNRLGNPPEQCATFASCIDLSRAAARRCGVEVWQPRPALDLVWLARAPGGSQLPMAEVAPAGAKEVDQRPNTHDPFWDSQNDILKTYSCAPVRNYCGDLREPPRHRAAAVTEATSSLGMESPRHRADAVTGATSRRWRGAPAIDFHPGSTTRRSRRTSRSCTDRRCAAWFSSRRACFLPFSHILATWPTSATK